MTASAGSSDASSAADSAGSDPHVQAQLRSHVQVASQLAWETSAFFVDRIEFQQIPAYARLDSGLTWHWKEGVALSLVGQNLLRDHHLEFVDSTGAARPTEIKRSAYVKLTWQF